jgi:TolA-binding protein
VRRRFWVGLTLLVAACATTSTRRTMPPAADDWIGTITAAKNQVALGHFDDADKALYEFEQRYPSSPEAREATYWRALFKLDPANRGGSPRAATERLDEYLADTTASLHRAEAATLRRIAAELDSLAQRTPVVASNDSARLADAQKAQQREDDLQKEIKGLRDQLDKTNAELERIKKRLQERTP